MPPKKQPSKRATSISGLARTSSTSSLKDSSPESTSTPLSEPSSAIATPSHHRYSHVANGQTALERTAQLDSSPSSHVPRARAGARAAGPALMLARNSDAIGWPLGSPARTYLNQTVTPHLLDGMRAVATHMPEKPLAFLATFLAERSRLYEGDGTSANDGRLQPSAQHDRDSLIVSLPLSDEARAWLEGRTAMVGVEGEPHAAFTAGVGHGEGDVEMEMADGVAVDEAARHAVGAPQRELSVDAALGAIHLNSENSEHTESGMDGRESQGQGFGSNDETPPRPPVSPIVMSPEEINERLKRWAERH